MTIPEYPITREEMYLDAIARGGGGGGGVTVTPLSVTENGTYTAPSGTGTRDNPIKYNNNMALEKDKYYTQYDVLYICTRNTINPVYNPLSELVGLYVQIVED